MSGTGDNVVAVSGEEDLFCPGCGYSLRGATGERCPECGYSLAYLHTDTSGIPWTHRRERGRLWTYWQTVWLVTFRTRRFCEEYAHSVGYSDSQAFRWVTVLQAYAPLLVGTVFLYLAIPTEPEVVDPVPRLPMPWMIPQGPSYVDQAHAEFWPVIVLHICAALLLLAVTGAPSYFFHPRSVSVPRQNNAVAMSYYTCAPLAFTPIVLAVVWVTFAAVSLDVWLASAWSLDEWLWPACALASSAVLLAWWWNAFRIVRCVMPQLPSRATSLAVGLPLLWLGFALTLVVLPLIVLFVLLVVVSLRA